MNPASTPSTPAQAGAIAPVSNLAIRFGRNKNVVAIASLGGGVRAWEKLRDENGLGASESPKVTIVDIATGKKVAKISYNGCVWANDGSEIAVEATA